MRNPCAMNKTDLIQKIKQLEGLTQDERSTLINLVNTKKKYGLVWEDKPEEVEEQLRTQLPVLREVVEKRILADEKDTAKEDEHFKVVPLKVEAPDTLFPEIEKKEKAIEETTAKGKAPNHILIEGDNLHALTALTFTHEGKIDVIYIDPPYNTGNKDFKYNDSFVDKEDSYRHSKWLSFMDKRLRIAKRLLSEKGVIFISIDDNEQSQLKMLCDEVFFETNFVGNVIWRSSDNSNNDAKQFSSDHNYTLVYSNKNGWLTNKLDRTEDQQKHYKNPDNDQRGPWFDGNPISSPNPRANLCYNINTPIGNVIKPPKNGWRWSKDTLEEKMSIGEIYFNENYTNIKRRTYLNDQQGLPPSSLWVDLEQTGHNRQAKYELLKIFPEKTKSEVFATPKPVKLIKRILETCIKGNSIILDFFAGSGSTLQAVMELNGDGSNHKCILVTNNENNICEEVTYERNRRVIQGYTNSKGEWVKGLINNNLRYYKSEFVGREPSLKNKRELARMATELLCIKEDCYEEKAMSLASGNNKADSKHIQYFEENNKRMMVVYDDSAIDTAVEWIKSIISNNKVPENGIKVYVFSPGQYPYTEEFEEVLPYITLCALPDALYKAFINVLPKKNRPVVPVLEDEIVDEPELFN